MILPTKKNTIHDVKSVPIRSYSGSHFPAVRTEYGEIRSISPYSVAIRENADQNNSEYGNVLRSVFKKSKILSNMISNNIYNKSQHFDIDVNVQVDNENTKTKQI